MNQKKAKALRKHLKSMGVNVNQKDYTMIGGRWGKNDKGEQVLEVAGTNRLKADCGRALYLKAKEVRV